MKTEREIKDRLIEWKKDRQKWDGDIIMCGITSTAIHELEWILGAENED